MKIVWAAMLSLLVFEARAGDLQWTGGGDELNAELRLSDPGKTTTPISFVCTPHVKVVYVTYEFRPANATEAMEFDFLLSAGGIDIKVGAIGYEVLMDKSFILEGQILFDQTFVDFIKSDGLLTITAEDKRQTFSLKGAREAAGPLLETCGREE